MLAGPRLSNGAIRIGVVSASHQYSAAAANARHLVGFATKTGEKCEQITLEECDEMECDEMRWYGGEKTKVSEWVFDLEQRHHAHPP
jgi:hypothetical protein